MPTSANQGLDISSGGGSSGGTVRVIINPAAGSGDTRKRWPGAIVALREAGLRPDYVLTDAPGHATALAQQAGLDGYDAVIAMGGDGTAHEVANGLLRVGSPPPLALLQTGTGRDLSRLLALPASLSAARPPSFSSPIGTAVPASWASARWTVCRRA